MEIRPFRAYRFNPQVVGNAGDCIVPPYDLSGRKQREYFYSKNKYNIIRIVSGISSEKDRNNDNQYTHAAQYLQEWIKTGALKQDASETIYGYVQNFTVLDRQYERTSFISLAKLEEYGQKVLAHEKTFLRQKEDCLRLQRATEAQFGLIFMLYEDATMTADKLMRQYVKKRPLLDQTDEDGVRHRLFAVTDAGDIEAITKMMSDKSCIIADGHHRYATALSYYNETKKESAGYQIMAFANTLAEGTIVLATHRLVSGLENFDGKKLFAGLKNDFEITEFAFETDEKKVKAKEKMLGKMKDESAKGKNAFGIYAGENSFKTAVLKDKAAMDKAAGEKSAAWRSLEVAVLHKLILEKILGITDKELVQKNYLEYVTERDDAVQKTIERIDAGEVQAAFFVNPEKIRSIQLVAQAGETMPQKSTFFFPKMYTGITIYKM